LVFHNRYSYWEEVGVVGKELVRNLAICAASVAVMIAIMIPHPKIAGLVIVSICLSVVEVLGFLHWWGVTISGKC
jgi:preprotein translocase subunit SecF